MTIHTLEDMYGAMPLTEEALEAILNRSLQPRSSEMVYHKMAQLGLQASHRVLDIGCRDATHTCELARRFGCDLLGVEPVQHQVEQAQRVVVDRGVGDEVVVRNGRIEAIPANDSHFDFIWCRDMLNHVPDLQTGLAECRRVLKPGGKILIYQTFATEALTAAEAETLYPPLVIVPANMSPAYFEATCHTVGLTILERDIVGSEWREYWEEDGTNLTAQQLLRIARMQRDEAGLTAELGPNPYAVELANCYWGVYQMLGKLCPTIYILQR